jgi:hypothetical protein
VYTKPGAVQPDQHRRRARRQLLRRRRLRLSWIHKYDKEHKYLKSFAGPGSEPGKCRTPHGLLLDTRVTPPVLLVADRENGRLQSFDLDGKFLSVIAGPVPQAVVTCTCAARIWWWPTSAAA